MKGEIWTVELEKKWQCRHKGRETRGREREGESATNKRGRKTRIKRRKGRRKDGGHFVTALISLFYYYHHYFFIINENYGTKDGEKQCSPSCNSDFLRSCPFNFPHIWPVFPNTSSEKTIRSTL